MMAKFEFTIETRYVGSTVRETVEIPDEELEDLEGYSRDRVIEEYYEEWRDNEIDGGWKELDAS